MQNNDSVRRKTSGSNIRPKGLLLPAMLFLISITQLPFFVTLYLSVKHWNILRPDQGKKFVGFENYVDLAHVEPSVFVSIENTLALTISTVLISTALGLALAAWLNNKFLGRALIRTLLLTPLLIMPVIVGQIWGRLFLDPGTGLLPWVARKIFNISFTPMSQYPMVTVIIISVWEWTPFAYLILTSGLNALDRSVVEAATVDGANRHQLFRYVTFPHLTSYLNITLLLATVLVLPSFGVIYATTAGGPGYKTTNLSLAVYQQLFLKYNVGGASALALINVVLVVGAMTGLIRLLGGILIRNEVLK